MSKLTNARKTIMPWRTKIESLASLNGGKFKTSKTKFSTMKDLVDTYCTIGDLSKKLCNTLLVKNDNDDTSIFELTNLIDAIISIESPDISKHDSKLKLEDTITYDVLNDFTLSNSEKSAILLGYRSSYRMEFCIEVNKEDEKNIKINMDKIGKKVSEKCRYNITITDSHNLNFSIITYQDKFTDELVKGILKILNKNIVFKNNNTDKKFHKSICKFNNKHNKPSAISVKEKPLKYTFKKHGAKISVNIDKYMI